MNLQRNYYEVLGVSPEATTRDIKVKYRELARKFHPDLVKDKALGVKVFSQVNQAYRILADTERRRIYDEQQIGNRTKSRSKATVAASNIAMAVEPKPVQNTVRTLTESQVAQLSRSLNLADNAIMEGQADQARQLCEAILRIDSQNARALAILGDAYVTLMRPEAAIKAFRRAMEISPSSMVEAKLRRLEQSANQSQPEQNPTQHKTASKAAQKPGGRLFSKLMGGK